MDRAAVHEKFNLSEISLLTAEKYIDYDDIDNPLKSYLKVHVIQQINIQNKVGNFVQMGQNTFNDETDRFQLFNGGRVTEYISFQQSLKYTDTG